MYESTNETMARAYANALSVEVNKMVKLTNYNTESHPRYTMAIDGVEVPFEMTMYDIKKNHSRDQIVTLEIIGAIIIGSNGYKDVRIRRRKPTDPEWDIGQTTIGRILTIDMFKSPS